MTTALDSCHSKNSMRESFRMIRDSVYSNGSDSVDFTLLPREAGRLKDQDHGGSHSDDSSGADGEEGSCDESGSSCGGQDEGRDMIGQEIGVQEEGLVSTESYVEPYRGGSSKVKHARQQRKCSDVTFEEEEDEKMAETGFGSSANLKDPPEKPGQAKSHKMPNCAGKDVMLNPEELISLKIQVAELQGELQMESSRANKTASMLAQLQSQHEHLQQQSEEFQARAHEEKLKLEEKCQKLQRDNTKLFQDVKKWRLDYYNVNRYNSKLERSIAQLKQRVVHLAGKNDRAMEEVKNMDRMAELSRLNQKKMRGRITMLEQENVRLKRCIPSDGSVTSVRSARSIRSTRSIRSDGLNLNNNLNNSLSKLLGGGLQQELTSAEICSVPTFVEKGRGVSPSSESNGRTVSPETSSPRVSPGGSASASASASSTVACEAASLRSSFRKILSQSLSKESAVDQKRPNSNQSNQVSQTASAVPVAPFSEDCSKRYLQGRTFTIPINDNLSSPRDFKLDKPRKRSDSLSEVTAATEASSLRSSFMSILSNPFKALDGDDAGTVASSATANSISSIGLSVASENKYKKSQKSSNHRLWSSFRMEQSESWNGPCGSNQNGKSGAGGTGGSGVSGGRFVDQVIRHSRNSFSSLSYASFLTDDHLEDYDSEEESDEAYPDSEDSDAESESDGKDVGDLWASIEKAAASKTHLSQAPSSLTQVLGNVPSASNELNKLKLDLDAGLDELFRQDSMGDRNGDSLGSKQDINGQVGTGEAMETVTNEERSKILGKDLSNECDEYVDMIKEDKVLNASIYS